jgi:hypothetical protein
MDIKKIDNNKMLIEINNKKILIDTKNDKVKYLSNKCLTIIDAKKNNINYLIARDI